MAEYTLFGQRLAFSDAAERYFDMRLEASRISKETYKELQKWYEDCGDISTVLTGYRKKATELVTKYVTDLLFSSLLDLEIYDVSRRSYDLACKDFKNINYAYDKIYKQYQAILREQESATAYREARKESRGRVSGGGFGVAGAVKGMATAGAMNAATGMGHSIANAIGNAGSALTASSSKSHLYNNSSTKEILLSGLVDDVFAAFNNHISYINEIKEEECEEYISFEKDIDKASALFENAQKLKEKETILLFEALTLWPWSREILKYIFVNFKEERSTIWEISKRHKVDLSANVADAISSEYTKEAQESEEKAQEAKQRILALMDEYGVRENETLDILEQDCLERICSDYKTTGGEANLSILEAFRNYDALNKNKATIIYSYSIWELALEYKVEFSAATIESILSKEYSTKAKTDETLALEAKKRILTIMQALQIRESSTFDTLERDCLLRICPNANELDEATCNAKLKEIAAYDALKKNKQPFIKALKNRVNDIWAEEDFAVFSELYRSTPVGDNEAIHSAIDIVLEKGRTDRKQSFVDALSNLNIENIQTAAKYAIAKEKGAFSTLLNIGKENIYNILTCEGRAIHPAICVAADTIKQEQEENKKTGLWGTFGKKCQMP